MEIGRWNLHASETTCELRASVAFGEVELTFVVMVMMFLLVHVLVDGWMVDGLLLDVNAAECNFK